MQRLACLAAGLLLAACATPIARVWSPLPADDPRPAALLEAWTRAAEERHSLRGRARLAVDGEDGDVHLRSRQVIALERPARLRVEIQGLLAQTIAVLVTDGSRYELFRAEDRSYETGPVHPGLLWEQAHIDLTPEEAIDLLLGMPRPDPGLSLAAAFGDPDSSMRLDLADADGRVRWRARFDAAGLLRRLEVFDVDGDDLWTATFGDYADVDGTPFAHALTLDVVGGHTRAEITLSDVQLNPELSPDIFRLRAPPGPAAAVEEGG